VAAVLDWRRATLWRPARQAAGVWPALGQAEGEPTFAKGVGNAFSNAALAEWVSNQGLTRLFYSGRRRTNVPASEPLPARRNRPLSMQVRLHASIVACKYTC
jgi:hypothetical protein